MLLICLFFLIICSHCCCCFFFNDIFYERAMSSPEKLHLKITIIIIIIVFMADMRKGDFIHLCITGLIVLCKLLSLASKVVGEVM